MLNGFQKWVALREYAEGDALPAGYDPFTTIPQKQGDAIYFGLHDLSRSHRETGSLPNLTMAQIGSKMGEITNADPIDQSITVSVDKAPFHYGYRKLESPKDKSRRFMDAEGKMSIKIPIGSLQNISHLMGDGDKSIWLVVDGNAKYQQGLMKEIRRKEVEKAASNAATRLYGHPALPQAPEPEEEYSLDLAHTKPVSNWKHHTDTRQYGYYPKA